jgi:hypothetical protein
MAASSNYNNKRGKPEYSYIGGSSRPQMVPPKPPSLNPASTSLSPVTVVYWGYWKKQDETIQIASTTEVSAAVGVTGTGSIGGVPTTASNLLNSAVSLLNASKPPTSQSGENVPSKSQGSSVYQVSPASNGKTITGNKASQATQPRTSSPQQAKFTPEEILSVLPGLMWAMKTSGAWGDKGLIQFFLNPAGYGQRMFPGLTPELFIEAAERTKVVNETDLAILKSSLGLL